MNSVSEVPVPACVCAFGAGIREQSSVGICGTHVCSERIEAINNSLVKEIYVLKRSGKCLMNLEKKTDV
jgi:hypothetical protein